MQEYFWLTLAEQRGSDLRAEAVRHRRARAARAGGSRRTAIASAWAWRPGWALARLRRV